jgi:hypothetical protein
VTQAKKKNKMSFLDWATRNVGYVYTHTCHIGPVTVKSKCEELKSINSRLPFYFFESFIILGDLKIYENVGT